MPGTDLMAVREAARVRRVPPGTLYTAIREGRLRSSTVVGTIARLHDDVLEYPHRTQSGKIALCSCPLSAGRIVMRPRLTLAGTSLCCTILLLSSHATQTTAPARSPGGQGPLASPRATPLTASSWPKFHADAQNTGRGGKGGAVGKVKWVHGIGRLVASSPALGVNGLLYVGCADDNLYALDAATGKRKWTFEARPRLERMLDPEQVIGQSRGG